MSYTTAQARQSSVMPLSCMPFAVDLSRHEVLENRGSSAASSTPDCHRVRQEKVVAGCVYISCNNTKETLASTVGWSTFQRPRKRCSALNGESQSVLPRTCSLGLLKVAMYIGIFQSMPSQAQFIHYFATDQ